MDALEKYKARMSEFSKVTDLNLSERLMKVVEEKHFWNTQLIDAKIGLGKLEKRKKSINKDLTEKVTQDSPVELNKKSLETLVKGGLEDIEDKIQDQKYLIEFLELTTKTVTFIAQDFKNIIALKQIEEL